MKKLIIKIGNETHELPYNDEVFSVEVIDKYVPKVGDCVRVKALPNNYFYWFKVTNVKKENAYFKKVINKKLEVSSGEDFMHINNSRIYTQITPEELKAKYAEAGYDWDYETDTIKPLKWNPKDGDEVWWLCAYFEPIKNTLNKDNEFLQTLHEKGFLFKTEEECQKFSEYCLSYIKNKKE